MMRPIVKEGVLKKRGGRINAWGDRCEWLDSLLRAPVCRCVCVCMCVYVLFMKVVFVYGAAVESDVVAVDAVD